MKALEASEQEFCPECNGDFWLLTEQNYPPIHILKERLNPEGISRIIRSCPIDKHDDNCVLIPNPHTHTVAAPCSSCNPNWRPVKDRPKPPQEQTPKERNEKIREAKIADAKRYWE